jgi:hypothetical protein
VHWETKKFMDSLYCGDLELNLQYLRGMPVHDVAMLWQHVEIACEKIREDRWTAHGTLNSLIHSE